MASRADPVVVVKCCVTYSASSKYNFCNLHELRLLNVPICVDTPFSLRIIQLAHSKRVRDIGGPMRRLKLPWTATVDEGFLRSMKKATSEHCTLGSSSITMVDSVAYLTINHYPPHDTKRQEGAGTGERKGWCARKLLFNLFDVKR